MSASIFLTRSCFLAICLHAPQSLVSFCVEWTSLRPHVSPVLYALLHCSRNVPHFQEPHRNCIRSKKHIAAERPRKNDEVETPNAVKEAHFRYLWSVTRLTALALATERSKLAAGAWLAQTVCVGGGGVEGRGGSRAT